jgi:oligoendopeptidase F
MRFMRFVYLLCAIMLLTSMISAQTKDRSSIPEKYKWKPEHIYTSLDSWQKDFNWLKDNIDLLANFKGQFAGDKATDPAKALIEFNRLSEEVSKKFTRVATYVSYNSDVNLGVSEWSGRLQQIRMLGVQYGQKLAWVEPEMLLIPETTMMKYVADHPDLGPYRKSYQDMYLLQAHTLSEKEEEILALSGNITGTASDVYSKLTSVDMKYGFVQVPHTDENGNPVKDEHGVIVTDSVEVSDAGYVIWRTDPDRKVREEYHNKLFSGYNDHGTTIAALMSGNIMKNVYIARARKYDNTLQAALYSDFIPEAVYNTLIETARKNAAPLHKYNEIRKRLLGLDHYRHWDYYASFIKGPEKRYTWEQGVTMVADALQPLGSKYLGDLTTGLNPGSGWVDPFYSKGKRGGAYSSGCYGVHPFMLYNFDYEKGLSMEDVSTVAHEVGHALHTFYSEKSQPYPDYRYVIFNAEVASTTNETMFAGKMIEQARTEYKNARGAAKEQARLDLMALLENQISRARDTFYRQTMFADFEHQINLMGENSQPITKESLDTLYLDLLKTYQGPALEYEPLSSVEWERIPHFYRNHYVFSYATSFAAAVALASDITAEAKGDRSKRGARDRYLTYLASGSSKHPVELLKDAGVDMSTPAPVVAFTQWFGAMVDELDALSRVKIKS